MDGNEQQDSWHALCKHHVCSCCGWFWYFFLANIGVVLCKCVKWCQITARLYYNALNFVKFRFLIEFFKFHRFAKFCKFRNFSAISILSHSRYPLSAHIFMLSLVKLSIFSVSFNWIANSKRCKSLKNTANWLIIRKPTHDHSSSIAMAKCLEM